ncbi:MAG: radical SAM protein [Candidatus Omnitrophota bacterium]|nr:MAG: radical SAM protein [Candidatus Omnitrophota bacterium]
MNHVVLIRLQSENTVITPPLGIGYLLKALHRIDEIRPVFIDCHRDKIGHNNLLKKIESLHPLLIGFQVFSIDYSHFKSLVPRIREMSPQACIIAGGPHISGLPERTLIDNPDLDFAVKGEGEETLQRLARGLLDNTLAEILHTIPNLVYRDRDRIVCNKTQLIDVNRYGPPAWQDLEPDKYPAIQHGTFHKSTRVVPILTSRGCPYPCTYCAGHLVTGKLIRRRDIGDVVDEIETLQSTYGFEEFIIEDENFTFYKEHVLQFSKEIASRNIQCYFSFPNGVRLDRMDKDIVLALKQMGTYLVGVGIESGSRNTLKAIKKNWDLQMVQEKIHLLKQHGLIVFGFFILGFPNETHEDIEQTIEFAIRSELDRAYFGNFIPLPGSADFNRLIRDGELQLEAIDWNTYTTYFGKIPYHPPAISAAELMNAVRRATLRFYLRPKILYNFLRQIMKPVMMKSLLTRVMRLFLPRRAA